MKIILEMFSKHSHGDISDDYFVSVRRSLCTVPAQIIRLKRNNRCFSHCLLLMTFLLKIIASCLFIYVSTLIYEVKQCPSVFSDDFLYFFVDFYYFIFLYSVFNVNILDENWSTPGLIYNRGSMKRDSHPHMFMGHDRAKSCEDISKKTKRGAEYASRQTFSVPRIY